MAFVLTYYRDQNITGRVCAEEENFISLRKKSKAEFEVDAWWPRWLLASEPGVGHPGPT